MNTSYLKNLKTPIAVIGLGKSGAAALSILKLAGFLPEQIITFDEKDTIAQIQSAEKLAELEPKTIVVSPGVSLKQKWLQDLISQGVHLTSEISLTASLLSTEKVIGVTGSVGKSTVVSILGLGAQLEDATAFVGGNLGNAFGNYGVRLLQGDVKAKLIVLELSSYQLENCAQLKLDYSIITYLSPNHLERYDSLEEYYQTKLKITEITKGLCLFNQTSEDCKKYAPQAKCEYELVNAASFESPDLISEVFLIGEHNKDNFALAAKMGLINDWNEDTLKEMTQYRGLAHRLEFVATLSDVTYVNDSKATAMDSVLVAVKGCLENLGQDKNLLLLLGGKDKNLPWEQLENLNEYPQVKPVFFGDCGALAREKSHLTGEYFEKLGSAINFCQKRAQRGDIVLLSPGGTSLDEFKNFEERGDFFKTLVLSNVEA